MKKLEYYVGRNNNLQQYYCILFTFDSAILIKKKAGEYMILVDKDICKRIDNGELIVSGYDEHNLNRVSYDLTIESVYDVDGKGHDSY